MCIVAFSGFAVGVNLTFPVAEKQGYDKGLKDISYWLSQKDINVTWTDLGDGRYSFEISFMGALVCKQDFEIHMLVQQYRNDALVSETYHAMNVTDFGKDWVEQQLFTDTNYTTNALFISSSNNLTQVDVAWTILPNEITSNGLARDDGDYTSTGTGAANVTYTFTITGTQSSCMYGLNAGSYAAYPNSLIAAEQQWSAARKNMVADDTLKITIQWSHS